MFCFFLYLKFMRNFKLCKFKLYTYLSSTSSYSISCKSKVSLYFEVFKTKFIETIYALIDVLKLLNKKKL